MRIQQHQVKLTDGANVINDWLWIDYHDRINVLVEAPNSSGTTPSFWVFEQTKYALEGRSSKAIIGGIIEPHEVPEHAAEREVREEMGVECANFYFLGRFRTDVNRGMGWVNSYLAADCKKAKKKLPEEGTSEEEVGETDVERQDLKTLSLEELKEASQKGEFLEVQWSNTVALALLHTSLQ